MKRCKILLALLLAAALLSGCAAPATARAAESDRGGTLEPVAFDQMVYQRPDPETLRAGVEELKAALDGGKSAYAVEKILDACYEAYYHFDTMYTLADIRSCRDLSDGYYAEEYQWCSENYAVVEQLMDELYYACGSSKLAQRLEKDYFWPGFAEEYANPEDSVYSDELVELMQQESAILAEYRALSASPTVEYQGEETDFNELLERLEGAEYYEVLDRYYLKYNERYADVFIRLVKVREQMAECMGYDSYEQMQYEYSYERDYTPEQAEGYLQEIRRTVVPYYRELMSGDPYGEVWYDLVDEQLLFDILDLAAEDIGGEVDEAFRFMERYRLYDITADPRKAGMSFQTYLSDYEAPYLFLDALGDTEDILSFAHEFGHYCDAYINYNADETTDLAECYSQAMEYLILTRLNGSLQPEDVDNIARLKLLDTAALYIQQASFAEFEHRVYALGSEALSAEALNELSLELAKEYGYFTPGYETYYGMSWIDVTHFFEQPFYVITYPVSNDIAMQVYALELEREGAGMEKYLGALDRDFSGLMDLVEAGSFESPFAEGRLDSVVALMRRVLPA